MQYQTLPQLFRARCAESPDNIAYRFKRKNEWCTITWAEQAEVCKQISKALIALGVRKDDRVSVLSHTRLEWVQSDLGIIGCAGVTVGIYPSNLAADCAYIIEHSDSETIIVENEEQLDKVLSVRQDLPNLRNIILIEGNAPQEHSVVSWQDFLARGDEVSDEDVEARASSLKGSDMHGIIYTSGTTGAPKGVMLSHRGAVFNSYSVIDSCHLEPHFEMLLFLPLAHVFARGIVYVCLAGGYTTAFAESLDNVIDNFREIRPHFFVSVPRIFEKVHEKVIAKAQAAGGIKKMLFNWAVGVGTEVSRKVQQKQNVTGFMGLKHKLADKLVLAKIRRTFGSRLAWAISGGAPLDRNLAEFFHACGVLIVEGIGMTENGSFSNINRYDNYKFGTVGPAGPGIEVGIADDGEVLTRAENTMLGYFKNSGETAETVDGDGWLHTGDIGEIDADGFLKITDRKKNIIVTAGGKNIAPLRVEQALSNSAYISQVLVYGDKRKYITALVTLNADCVTNWCAENGIDYHSLEELAENERVVDLINQEVQRYNQSLASFESVKKIRIVPGEFSISNGELTPTLKIKRKVVIERYKDLIEEMYSE